MLTRALIACLIACLLLTAYLWTSVNLKPRAVPLGVAAPEPVAQQLEAALDQAVPGGFDVRPVADADRARALIQERELYGAVVIGADGIGLLTASAASAPVARALETLPQRLAAAPGAEPGAQAQVTVEDVAPLPAADPNGAAFVMLVIITAVVGLVSGVITALTVRGRGRRFAAALACGAAVGLVAGLIAGPWLGVVGGSYWANAGLVALAAAAVALAVAGVHSAVGAPGIPLIALLVFGGNPFSGAQGGPLLVPGGWAELGQALPPGAFSSALRSAAYFDGQGIWGPVAVLCAWAAAGALALALGRRARAAAEAGRAAPGN
ncbi:MAG: hypothetical protein LBL01_01970, partial [Bifidobacteriaceae bacterium]|nr:hypothetical protein [Bifidobacteriaceae bacterium]